MESLQINTGLISVRILNDFGEERGVFRFNPTDVNLARAVIDLQNEFAVKQKEFEQRCKECETEEDKVHLLDEIVTYYRGVIDECFGSGSSDILFGDAKSLTMFDDFFNGILPYFEKARKAVKAKYAKPKNK